MAGMKLSHVLLIVALSTWLMALFTNLFFPFLLYSFEAAPLFVRTITSIFEIPAHYLINALLENRQDYFAMICFLAAIACSFIASSVYGMGRESERYLSLFSDFEADNAANLSFNDADCFYDLEKGGLPIYQGEEGSYTENNGFTYTPFTDFPHANVQSTFSAYIDVPSSSTRSASPIGDAMIGQYYDSRAEFEHAQAQALAQRELITQNRVAELVLGEEHFSDVYHPCSGRFACNSVPAVPVAATVPATPRLSPVQPAPTPANRGVVNGFTATVYDPSVLPEGSMYAAVMEEFHDVELFSIYETEGAREGVWDFDGVMMY